MEQADLLIVGTPHDCYKGLTFRQPVIDVTNTIHPTSAVQAHSSLSRGVCKEGTPK
jgi:hypothetical protein